MGLFSRLFKKNEEQERESTVFYAEQDELIKQATKKAQASFKYFWRELYWEYRRIIPAHGFAMIKLPFEQIFDGQNEPIIEHMWVNEINFDGEFFTGTLVNTPNDLTNISVGDLVKGRVNEIDDWLISIQGKTLGGFTIQAMRAAMSDKERKSHDKAWGLDFGDINEVLLVHEQKENPENLLEHPMSVNMAEKLKEFINEHPNELFIKDENGLTLLHKESIAGNGTSVEVLLGLGADKSAQSNKGKTALDYAKSMDWKHVVELLG